MDKKIEGLFRTSLKIIPHELGSIMHILKKDDSTYTSFGEAYFTQINYSSVKGWKKHSKMVLNLIVPIGEVMFYFYDDREASSSYKKVQKECLSIKKYSRLTVPPGIWVAFKGLSKEMNLILNVASIKHDPDEAINQSLSKFPIDINSI